MIEFHFVPRLTILSLTILFGLTIQGQSNFQLLSPDKTIGIDINAAGRLSYSLSVDGKKLMDGSVINMKLGSGMSLSANLKRIKVSTRTVHETIVAPIPVSRKYIPDVYNE